MNADIFVSTNLLLFAVASAIALILLSIFIGKLWLKKNANKNLSAKYKDKQWASPLTARNKYPDVDTNRLSGPLFGIGLILVIGIIIAALSWTTFENDIFIPDNALELDADIEIEPPRSTHEQPPPPPPPPPVIQEVPEEVFIEEEPVEFVDQSVEAETAVEVPPPPAIKKAKKELPPPPPPPPPPPETKVEEIFKIVEEMPRFPGCENSGLSKEEKKVCSEGELLKFIYSNIKYPNIARENGIEGTVVIQFVVDEDGKVNDATILRDIGAQCGEEALRVVNLMNTLPERWSPGKQRGISVKVMYMLPVKFRLETT